MLSILKRTGLKGPVKSAIKLAFGLLFSTLFCLVPASSQADPPAVDPLHFTILHTNDLHSHDQPFLDHGQMVGGMARIIHLIRQLRADQPDTLVIDAGDIFAGSLFFTQYHGQVEVSLLNTAGYDLYTIGNHEFDLGPANLTYQLKNAKFQIICCNLDTAAYPALGALIKPAVVKTIQGQKVGFIGVIVPDLKKVTTGTDGIKVINAASDWMAPVREEIARLKQDGVKEIILVTHVGVDLDKQLAKLNDVSAIIGGHSHTRLDPPIIVEHADGSHCIIVQTGCYGRALGKLDLAFTQDGRLDVANTHDKLIDIINTVKADDDIVHYLEVQSKPFLALRKQVVGTAKGDFSIDFNRFASDSPIGDLVTDALAEGVAKYGATVALQNRGGIRSAVNSGPITAADVDEMLPYNYSLVVSTLSGSQLKNILETSVSGTATSRILLGIKFLDVHGMKFEWDPTLSPMHRVKSIWVANKFGRLEPLKDDGQYRVAINSYAFGYEGYDFTKAQDVVDTHKMLSAFLQDYLRKHKTVSPQTPDRIIPLNPLPTGDPSK